MYTYVTVAVLVFGLATVTAMTPDVQAVTSLTDLAWKDLELPADHRFAIDAASPVLDMQDIKGPVAAFRVPVDGRTLAIEATSYVGKKSVLPPRVVILDERLALLGASSPDALEYRSRRLLEPDRLTSKVEVTPPAGDKHVHLLVHSRAEDLAGTTTVRHPAKSYADARQQAAPNIPDLVVQHAPYGTLRITVRGMGPMPMVEAAATPARTHAEETERKVLPQTRDYFTTAIREAVRSTDLERALALLEEAERLGVPGARETFIEAVARQREQPE